MNHILILAMAAILLLAYGCMNKSADDLFDKYQQLEFNMTESEIIDVLGTPDRKIPKLVGETWIWADDQNIDRIALYLSPQKRWLEFESGRLIVKKWLDAKDGV